MYTVYIIESQTTKRYYIGQTNDIRRRLEYHNEGKTVSTRKRGPWILKYQENYETRIEAIQREKFLKRQRNRQFYNKLIAGSSSVG